MCALPLPEVISFTRPLSSPDRQILKSWNKCSTHRFSETLRMRSKISVWMPSNLVETTSRRYETWLNHLYFCVYQDLISRTWILQQYTRFISTLVLLTTNLLYNLVENSCKCILGNNYFMRHIFQWSQFIFKQSDICDVTYLLLA